MDGNGMVALRLQLKPSQQNRQKLALVAVSASLVGIDHHYVHLAFLNYTISLSFKNINDDSWITVLANELRRNVIFAVHAQLKHVCIISDISDIINPALMMSPRLVMKRLQSNCQARRTDQQSISAPELPIFHNIADPSSLLVDSGLDCHISVLTHIKEVPSFTVETVSASPTPVSRVKYFTTEVEGKTPISCILIDNY
ncbi:hypothetical protein CSKR_105527 [Clonorchis sinensis]|uniref:Uncharacterized protein n=1 Tax=Clonorchis sinensis TaxID=79923 RepID=A0A3R7C6K0_CLOSI|nr:hypothetical protein CSKR_105527 [Clonorchis sinensis]